MTLSIRSFSLYLILTYSSASFAYFIDHLKLQYAGEIGLVSIGMGKQVTPSYSFDFFYGYVPESMDNNEIETFAFKNYYDVTSFGAFTKEINFYGGINLYHVIGLKYQTSRLSSYPRSYYRMASIRALLFLGLNMNHRKNTKFYFESGVNDIWLINYANNAESLNISDYISHAFGWTYIF